MIEKAYDWSEWIVLSAYIILGVVGTLGNSFILYVIWKYKMQTTTFWLVGNQAFSDLSCGLLYLVVWFTCSSAVIGQPGGHLSCEIIYTLKISTFFVSCYTMTAISIDRYTKLYYPHSRGSKPSTAIIGTWIAGLSIAVFSMFKFRSSEFFTSERLVGCRWGYASSPVTQLSFFQKHNNMLLLFVFGLCTPISVTAFCYIRVVQKLKARKAGAGTGRPTSSVPFEKNEPLKISKEKQTRRTTRMLMTTMICYTSLCSPLYIIFITDYFITSILPLDCNASTHETWYFLIAYFCCVFSICINPAIYCCFNKQFKTEGKLLLANICGGCFRNQNHESMPLPTTSQSSEPVTVGSS